MRLELPFLVLNKFETLVPKLSEFADKFACKFAGALFHLGFCVKILRDKILTQADSIPCRLSIWERYFTKARISEIRGMSSMQLSFVQMSRH
jgi:hypothetical protein